MAEKKLSKIEQFRQELNRVFDDNLHTKQCGKHKRREDYFCKKKFLLGVGTDIPITLLYLRSR